MTVERNVKSTNPATNIMGKLTGLLINIDEKLKDMGTEKYGTVRATPKEQRDMIAQKEAEDAIL